MATVNVSRFRLAARSVRIARRMIVMHMLLASVLVAMALAVAPITAGYAHGKPEHGGAFREVKEYTFEVLAKRQGDNVEFTVFVKDPLLKPVTSGQLKVVVNLPDKTSTTVSITPAGEDSYRGSVALAKSTRHKLALTYIPPGKGTLKVSMTVKE